MEQITDKDVLAKINIIKNLLQTCLQCGTCTASCPNVEAMDITPRHMWRLLMTDHMEALFSSHSFMMCSSCYYCTLRCPRGLELTRAMTLLKQTAFKLKLFRRSFLFYNAFINSVRKHGRVREMEFMTHYFIAAKNPFLPISYAPLGFKLISRGKIRPDFTSSGKGKLTALFKKTAEVEE